MKEFFSKYNKKFILTSSIIILTSTLTGCLQMMSPTVAQLEDGSYILNAQSNAFGSRNALRTKLLKKAGEVCTDKGFDELDHTSLTYYNNAYTAGVAVPIPVATKSNVLKIKCKE